MNCDNTHKVPKMSESWNTFDIRLEDPYSNKLMVPLLLLLKGTINR